MRRSVNPAAMQVGKNRGKIGVLSALGDILCLLVIYISQFLEEPTIGSASRIAVFSALRLLSLSSIHSLVDLTLAVCLSRMAFE